MSASGRTGTWQRWSLVAVAVVLLTLIGVAFTFDPDPATETATDLSVSAVFALLVLATAGQLLRTDRAPEGVWLVASRAVGGAAVFGALGAWAAVTIEGGASSTATYVAFAAAPGAAAGTALGLIDDRRRREYRRASRVRRAIEASIDGIAVLDGNREYLTVNDAYCAMVDREPSVLVGEPWSAVTPLGEHESVVDIDAALDAGGSWRGQVVVPLDGGDERQTELSVSRLPDGGSVVVLRDVSERATYERRLRRLQSATRRLMYAESVAGVGRVTVDIAEDDLGWPLSSFWEHDESADELVLAATTAATATMLEESGLEGLGPLTADTVGMEAFRGDEIVVVANYEASQEAAFDLPVGTMLLAPVGDHGLLVCGATEETGLQEAERAFVDILRLTAEAGLDRVDRESQIQRLQAATAELPAATTREEVATAAVDIAEDVLDRPLAVVWHHDKAADALVPAATSDGVRELLETHTVSGTVGTFGAGTLEWDAFRSGETHVVEDDASLGERAGSDLPLGTIAYAPLGEHGLLGIGSRERQPFSTTDRYLVDILRRTTAAALERTEREQELRAQQQRLGTVVENAPVVLFTYDTDGRFTLVQGRGLEGTGIDPETLVGQSVYDVFAGDDALLAAVDAALAGTPGSVTAELAGQVFQTWYRPLRDEDGRVTGVIGTALDVTERRERDRQLSALHEASRELSYAETPETVASVTVEIASEVLDRPFSTLWAYDDATDRLDLVAMAEETRAFLAETDSPETLDPLGPQSVGMGAYRERSLRVVEDYDAVESRALAALSLGTVLVVPVGDYGVLELGGRDTETVTEADRQHAELLAANAATALDRAEREAELRRRQRMVETLHDATRELLAADDTREVCEIAVRAAERALDEPVVGIWVYDDEAERLVPTAYSEESAELFAEHPVYTAADQSLSWLAFVDGETRVYDDLRAADGVANPGTLVRSELIVPVGEYGVMNVGSALPGQFGETAVHVAQLLAASTEAAFDRAERERELRERTDELELRTSQMDFFNSILRHDVLNGMTVIRARGEFLTDALEGREREFAETIVRWCDDVTDVVGRVRTVLDTLTGTTEIAFQPVDVVGVVREELDRIEQTYPSVAFETDLPDAAWASADDLFAEVVGNVITNAVEHNDIEGLRVQVRAETDGDRVRLSVTDNGSGVRDGRKERVFRRGETGHAKATGSGFGLFFADAMVSAYGGDIWVEDADVVTNEVAGGDPGGATSEAHSAGARFVIELPRAEVPAAPPTEGGGT